MQVYAPTEVDTGPELLDCAGYSDPPSGRSASGVLTLSARVEFVVTDDGTVTRPIVTEANSSARAAGIPQRALRAARGCSYKPATLDGEPVAVQWRERFSFEVSR